MRETLISIFNIKFNFASSLRHFKENNYVLWGDYMQYVCTTTLHPNCAYIPNQKILIIFVSKLKEVKRLNCGDTQSVHSQSLSTLLLLLSNIKQQESECVHASPQTNHPSFSWWLTELRRYVFIRN
jgi:hypothetical protein